jgi:hypothetical protein
MSMRSPSQDSKKKKIFKSPFNKSNDKDTKTKLIDETNVLDDDGSDIEIDDNEPMDNDHEPAHNPTFHANRNSSPPEVFIEKSLANLPPSRGRSSDNVLISGQRKDPSIESLTANLQKKRIESSKYQKMLTKGRSFIKINKLSKPGQRFITLSQDSQYILIFKDEQDWKTYQSNPQ